MLPGASYGRIAFVLVILKTFPFLFSCGSECNSQLGQAAQCGLAAQAVRPVKAFWHQAFFRARYFDAYVRRPKHYMLHREQWKWFRVAVVPQPYRDGIVAAPPVDGVIQRRASENVAAVYTG
jgi:hypothetical protein